LWRLPPTSRACNATRNPSSDQLAEAPYMSRWRTTCPDEAGIAFGAGQGGNGGLASGTGRHATS
jgi:hypothetical protein